MGKREPESWTSGDMLAGWDPGLVAQGIKVWKVRDVITSKMSRLPRVLSTQDSTVHNLFGDPTRETILIDLGLMSAAPVGHDAVLLAFTKCLYEGEGRNEFDVALSVRDAYKDGVNTALREMRVSAPRVNRILKSVDEGFACHFLIEGVNHLGRCCDPAWQALLDESSLEPEKRIARIGISLGLELQSARDLPGFRLGSNAYR